MSGRLASMESARRSAAGSSALAASRRISSTEHHSGRGCAAPAWRREKSRGFSNSGGSRSAPSTIPPSSAPQPLRLLDDRPPELLAVAARQLALDERGAGREDGGQRRAQIVRDRP